MLKSIVNGAEHDIVSIPMKGKNLFDDDNVEYGEWINNDGSTALNAPYAAGYDIDVGTASEFTIKYYGDKPYSYSMVFYDSNGDFLSRVHKRSPSSSYDAFPVPENAASARFQVACQTIVTMTSVILKAMKLMLNTGNQALPYEPYGYQEGWEVRDSQDRLIWGREDELQTATGTLPFKGYSLPVKVKSLLGNAVQNGGTTTVPQKSVTVAGIESGTDYAMFLKSDFPDVALGDEVNIIVGGTTHSLAVKKLDVQYVYVENEAV